MKNIIFSLLLFLTVFASAVSESKSIDNDPEPPSPEFWHFFNVEGLDSDNDGVRDDVEIWINNYTQEYHYNFALKQYARVQQKVFSDE